MKSLRRFRDARGGVALKLLLLLGLIGASAMSPSRAAAEAEPRILWQGGESCGVFSAECGFKAAEGSVETLIPRGIAADPITGHVFVADMANQRVVEFDAWGQFVKAWGWGVRDGKGNCRAATRQAAAVRAWSAAVRVSSAKKVRWVSRSTPKAASTSSTGGTIGCRSSTPRLASEKTKRNSCWPLAAT